MQFIKKIFPLLAVLLLAPWPIAYAHTYADDMVRHDTVQIEVAEPPAALTSTVFGKTIGGITTPIDLFYIDTTDNTADITATLYITNTQELCHCYSYLILKVGVYVKSNVGEWKQASRCDGKPIPETFITLRNGQVSFTLAGYANYKVTIDSGCFYCITTNANGGSLSPQFYLEVV